MPECATEIPLQCAGANLIGADLSGLTLTGINFSGANLIDAILTGATLGGADLSGAYLTGANLNSAYLTVANLGGAYLDGASLDGANLDSADLTGADLTGAILTGANLAGATLTGANLTNANLDRTYVRGAILTDATLTDANLTGADLTGATLIYANLTNADLTGATLTNATLTNAVVSDSSVCPERRLVSATGSAVSLTARGAPNAAFVRVSLSPDNLLPANTTHTVQATLTNNRPGTATGSCDVLVVQPPTISSPVTSVKGRAGSAMTRPLGTITAHPAATATKTGTWPPGLTLAISPTGQLTITGTPTRAGTYAATAQICNHAAIDPAQSTCVQQTTTLTISAAATTTPSPSPDATNTPTPVTSGTGTGKQHPATGSSTGGMIPLSLALIGAGLIASAAIRLPHRPRT